MSKKNKKSVSLKSKSKKKLSVENNHHPKYQIHLPSNIIKDVDPITKWLNLSVWCEI